MSIVLLPNQLANGRLQVRVAWGADPAALPATWTYTDVTSDVSQDNNSGISITIGRANEASVAQPANCTLRFKNQTGAYTPYNPTSTNYPNVRLGTPVQVRVSLDGGSSWSVRFQGEASAWTPGWDAQGRKAFVTLTASGITRRLGQGSKPLPSSLYRAYTHSSITPLGYWPLEDGPSAIQIASGLTGGSPALITLGKFSFGQVSTCPGSAPLPQMGESPDEGHALGPITAGGDTFWSIDFTAFVESATLPADAACPVGTCLISSGTWSDINYNFNNNFGSLQVFNTRTGSLTQDLVLDYDPGNLFDGVWHHYRITASQSGGNVDFGLEVDGVSVLTNTVAGTIAHLTSAIFYAQNSVSYSYGHFAVFGQPTIGFYTASTGHTGELADARLTRLCGEEGISLTIAGTSDITMGPQGVDTLMNLLRECETADVGFLVDGISAGLNYTARSAIYNESAQLTVNANSGHIPASPGPLPTEDDQRLRNRVTVTNPNTSSVIAEDEDGPLGTAALGVFDDRRVVNTDASVSLQDIATWLIHLGTVEGMRYPAVVLDFTRASSLVASWVSTVPTDRIDLTNLSSQLSQHPAGTVSLLVDGYAELLSARKWQAVLNCSNFRPWEVFSIADSRLGRIETDGSTLSSSATNTATSLSVAFSGGKWDTSAAPFDIEIEGEQVTVTAISGSTSPQTFTVTRSVNSVVKAHSSGATVKLWKPGVIAL